MANNEQSPAHEQPPWYVGRSECEGVYGGVQHWAVLADDCRGIVADLEGGLGDKARGNAEFIVRACNTHADLLELAQAFRQECSDQIQQHRDDIKEDFGDSDDLQEMVEYWKDRREQCDAAITKAYGKPA